MNRTDVDKKSVAFSPTFVECHHATICADTCSDENIIDRSMLESFQKTGEEHSVEVLNQPCNFEMAVNLPNGRTASLTRGKVVIVETEIHIRYGTALTLLWVRWLVTDQNVGEPLLGIPVLEALGLNTRDILPAVAEKFSSSVDITDLITEGPEPIGKVPRILEGVIHAYGGAYDADLDEEDERIYLEPENSV